MDVGRYFINDIDLKSSSLKEGSLKLEFGNKTYTIKLKQD